MFFTRTALLSSSRAAPSFQFSNCLPVTLCALPLSLLLPVRSRLSNPACQSVCQSCVEFFSCFPSTSLPPSTSSTPLFCYVFRLFLTSDPFLLASPVFPPGAFLPFLLSLHPQTLCHRLFVPPSLPLLSQRTEHTFQGLLTSNPAGASTLSVCPRRYPVNLLSRSIML